MKIKILLLSLFCLCLPSVAFANKIAITFDDLPAQEDASAEEQRKINKRILKALKKFGVPAIGFVNEGKLYSKKETKEKIEILKTWVDNGHLLGNHTFSHPALSNTDLTLKEYKEDIVKGAKISKGLMSKAGLKYTYFRHPYLDTGTTKERRSEFEKFLKEEDYIIAPVTIDTDDWKFNMELTQNPSDKEKIIQRYLDHTKAKFAFYEYASKRIFGRNIRHIWLLHVNLINSYSIEGLIKIAKDYGYEFVTLEHAMQDSPYSEKDNYYAPFGVSWLYRWDFTRGKVVDWNKEPEPDNNPFISSEEIQFFDGKRKRNIPTISYVSAESKGKALANIKKLPVVVINHGYGGKNSEYSFLANALSEKGYFVISIQHDLKGDPDYPKKDELLFEERMQFWDTGAENIKFVITELKKKRSDLDFDRVIVIGHSKGGDIAMLFVDRYSRLVSKAISLDSLRYPFPRKKGVKILSLRAYDKKPEKNVIPKSGVKVIYMKAKHTDMYDKGPHNVKLEIIEHVAEFLRND